MLKLVDCKTNTQEGDILTWWLGQNAAVWRRYSSTDMRMMLLLLVVDVWSRAADLRLGTGAAAHVLDE